MAGDKPKSKQNYNKKGTPDMSSTGHQEKTQPKSASALKSPPKRSVPKGPTINVSRRNIGTNWQQSKMTIAPDTSTNPPTQLKHQKRGGGYLAIDCEMVEGGKHGNEDSLASVAVIDSNLECIFMAYVRQRFPVTDYRTKITGLTKDILTQRGQSYHKVRSTVSHLLQDKILVGFAVRNDLQVLGFPYKEGRVIDVQRMHPYGLNKARKSLKNLSSMYLQRQIQTGAHSPIEDAEATMQLFLKAPEIIKMIAAQENSAAKN